MDITAITQALSAHQGSWDSWGWHCMCGAGERLTNEPMPEPEDALEHSQHVQSRARLLEHQAVAVSNA